jgi:hypothetical protein
MKRVYSVSLDLVDKRLASIGMVRNYDLAPDGKRVLTLCRLKEQMHRCFSHVIFVVNFADEAVGGECPLRESSFPRIWTEESASRHMAELRVLPP